MKQHHFLTAAKAQDDGAQTSSAVGCDDVSRSPQRGREAPALLLSRHHNLTSIPETAAEGETETKSASRHHHRETGRVATVGRQQRHRQRNNSSTRGGWKAAVVRVTSNSILFLLFLCCLFNVFWLGGRVSDDLALLTSVVVDPASAVAAVGGAGGGMGIGGGSRGLQKQTSSSDSTTVDNYVAAAANDGGLIPRPVATVIEAPKKHSQAAMTTAEQKTKTKSDEKEDVAVAAHLPVIADDEFDPKSHSNSDTSVDWDDQFVATHEEEEYAKAQAASVRKQSRGGGGDGNDSDDEESDDDEGSEDDDEEGDKNDEMEEEAEDVVEADSQEDDVDSTQKSSDETDEPFEEDDEDETEEEAEIGGSGEDLAMEDDQDIDSDEEKDDDEELANGQHQQQGNDSADGGDGGEDGNNNDDTSESEDNYDDGANEGEAEQDENDGSRIAHSADLGEVDGDHGDSTSQDDDDDDGQQEADEEGEVYAEYNVDAERDGEISTDDGDVVDEEEGEKIANAVNKALAGNVDGPKSTNRVLSLLKSAGADLSEWDRTKNMTLLQQLPSWEQISSLYYRRSRERGNNAEPEPIVHGLDTCQKYRDTVSLEDAFLGIAGLFNTGTNAMNWLLSHNFDEDVLPVRWQVPWGKHRLEKVKWIHDSPDRSWGMYNRTNILPIVVIKDPLTWMQSMCKSPYEAHWKHRSAHCPNLRKYTQWEKDNIPVDPIPVKIVFDKNSTEPFSTVYWDSLVHLYNDWYMQYYNATYPRLIVRFEDLLFLPDKLLKVIARCVVGTSTDDDKRNNKANKRKRRRSLMRRLLRKEIRLQVDASKSHGKSSDLVHAMIKYGSGRGREQNMTQHDKEFAIAVLSSQPLLETFDYPPPSGSEAAQVSVTHEEQEEREKGTQGEIMAAQ